MRFSARSVLFAVPLLLSLVWACSDPDDEGNVSGNGGSGSGVPDETGGTGADSSNGGVGGGGSTQEPVGGGGSGSDTTGGGGGGQTPAGGGGGSPPEIPQVYEECVACVEQQCPTVYQTCINDERCINLLICAYNEKCADGANDSEIQMCLFGCAYDVHYTTGDIEWLLGALLPCVRNSCGSDCGL